MTFDHINDARFVLRVLNESREQSDRMPYELHALDQLIECIETNNPVPEMRSRAPTTRTVRKSVRKGASHV